MQKYTNRHISKTTIIFSVIALMFLTACGGGASVPIIKSSTFNLAIDNKSLFEGKTTKIEGVVVGKIEGVEEKQQNIADKFFVDHLKPIVTDLLNKLGSKVSNENADYQFKYTLNRLPESRIIRSQYNISENKLRLIPITGRFADKNFRAITRVNVTYQLYKNDELIKSKDYVIDQYKMIIEVDRGHIEARQAAIALYEKEQMKALKDFFDSLN